MKIFLILLLGLFLSNPCVAYDVYQIEDVKISIDENHENINKVINNFIMTIKELEKCIKNKLTDGDKIIELKNKANEDLESLISSTKVVMDNVNPFIKAYKAELTNKIDKLFEDDPLPPENNYILTCHSYQKQIIDNIDKITYKIVDISRVTDMMMYQPAGSTIETNRNINEINKTLKPNEFLKELNNIKEKFKKFPSVLENLKNKI